MSVSIHENLNDALKEVVLALGGTKRVGARLWPEKSADEAGRRLADCLNPDRRDRLDPEQVLWLLREGRRVDCHAAMFFVCATAGYEKPEALNDAERKALLHQEFVESSKRMEMLWRQINALNDIDGGVKNV